MLCAKYPPLRAAKARMNVMWMIAVMVFVVVRMRIVIGSRSSSCSRKITILDHSIMGNGGSIILLEDAMDRVRIKMVVVILILVLVVLWIMRRRSMMIVLLAELGVVTDGK